MKHLLAATLFFVSSLFVLAFYQAGVHSGCQDFDSDGICNTEDNCFLTANPEQGDTDGDGRGDACDQCPSDPDNDIDHDGICGDVDNCPTMWNPDQRQAADPEAPCEPTDWVGPFIRGDIEQDFFVTPKDALTIWTWLYIGRPPPPCLAAADANADGRIDISDPIWIFIWLFIGGEPMPAPVECDISSRPGDIALGCERELCQ